MATSAGPNLEGVKNNDLLLSFDAHDAKSYPGEPTMNMVQLPNNLTATGNWNVTKGTLANDQIDGPNGRRAGSLTATDSDPYIYSSFIFYVATGNLTFSAYVKGSSNSIGMGGDIRINFGTSAGQATGSNATSYYTITGDWQRVSVTATVTGAGTIKVGVEAPNSATAGQVVYIADIQLEQKYRATPFVVGPNPNDDGTYMGRPATVDFMLHGNVGTGTTFSDSGANALTITNTNSVTHSAASKFNGGSIKFVRSSSQYLSSASTSAGNFGTGDWTIDFWFNMTSGQTDRMHAFCVGTGNTANIDFNFNDGNAFWLYFNGTGTPNITFGSDGDYGDGQWHHLAATRYNGMIRVWVDGVHKGSNNYSSSTSMGQTASLYIGSSAGAAHYWDGYLDEIRVVKGTALWKGSNDFVPPTRRGAGGPLIDRSSNRNNGTLLNGTDTAYANRRNGQVIEPVSVAYIDFDGTDERISTNFGSTLNPNTTPFSICAWVKSDSATGSKMWVDVQGNGSNQRFYSALITDDNPSAFGIQSTAWSLPSSADTSKWYHQAIVMDNVAGIAQGYSDGKKKGQRTFSSYTLNNNFVFGGRNTYYWDGQIAIVQIFNGILTEEQVKQNFEQHRNRFGI